MTHQDTPDFDDNRPAPVEQRVDPLKQLSPAQRALLLKKLRRSATRGSGMIPRRPQEGPCPPSFSQQRMWFFDQLESDGAAYNVHNSVRLQGLLDADVLEKCLNEIVRRHEALRTNIKTIDGGPVQTIAAQLTLRLRTVDLRSLPEDRRLEEAKRVCAEDANMPFDLGQDVLLRTTLVRLDEEDHVFSLTMHHAISDGWSLAVFWHELGALYPVILAGAPAALSELPIQYADFSVWQREQMQGEILASQLEYWQRQLADSPPVLELPTDFVRPPVQTFQGAGQVLSLSRELTQKVKDLCHKEGATLFMTLLATFKLLLNRYTGQEDILVGTPVAGRNRAEIEGLIGFFVNSLVLRSKITSEATFLEFLAQVRDVSLSAFSHQDVPFEKLVEQLQPDRNTSRPPLFQVFFNMYNFNKKFAELPGLTTEILAKPDERSKFDLTLYAMEIEGEVELRLVYNTDLFRAERMVEMMAQYHQLLEQIVNTPDQPVSSYSIVTPQAQRLLPDPTRKIKETHQEPIPQTIADWARRSPGEPAIRQGVQTWTYDQLQTAAEALARALTAEGTQRGEVVAVCGSRSFGLVAGMAGVFASGGVLLSLDQSLPGDRQRLMLQQAKAKRLLYVGSPRPEDQWMFGQLEVTRVDPDTAALVDQVHHGSSAKTEFPEISPNDPAYIFFTSGTTGVPKGVLGCHKGLAHFLRWQRETFSVGSADRVGQLTGLSFDVVLRDILLPLTGGATLCLPPKDIDFSPTRILPWIDSQQITLLHLVPTLAQSWFGNTPPDISLRHLRCIFFAGEPLTDATIRQWRQTFPDAGEIINLYGPTETTMAKCFYRVPAEIHQAVQPVGRPLPETQALVLTKNRQLCGIGETGEIVLRTPYRTYGYINSSDEMKRRFVKNPFRDEDDDLLYFTGDRGRYCPDGSLEILGRLDDQIKIRGVRIEPAEITAVLAEHTEIKQCIVTGYEDTDGNKQLVAYVAPISSQALTASELRNYLQPKLPEVMIPTVFAFLEELPMTPNGKVDRRALPDPELCRKDTNADFVAPQTSTEQELVDMWAELLLLERIGTRDSFFDLGGHSLLATQLVSRLRDSFGVDVSLKEFFTCPTVSALAEMIEIKLLANSNPAMIDLMLDTFEQNEFQD